MYKRQDLVVGTHTVTVNDGNEAVLGSLTTLGDGTTGGRLVAGTATPDVTTDNVGLPDDFLLEDGKNVTGRGTIAGNFRNMGSVIGDGVALDERIVFDDGFTVNGIGYTENVLVEGTFAPGLSPGVVTGRNIALAGRVQIELGGTSPGTGDSFHDQIHDLGSLQITGTASLEVLPWNGFQPDIGDEFDILVADESFEGTFGNVTVHSDFAAMNIDFELQYSANGLKLVAVSTAVSCDFDGDADCDIGDIDAIITGIATGTGDAAFDLTGDGIVDLADRDQWLLDAGILNIGGAYLPGDANLDGVVDGSDFNRWNANRFASTGRWSQGDFNADGVTDGSDFNVWNANKFQASDRDSMLTLDLSDDDQAGKDEEAISVVDRVFSDFGSKF